MRSKGGKEKLDLEPRTICRRTSDSRTCHTDISYGRWSEGQRWHKYSVQVYKYEYKYIGLPWRWN